MTFLSWIPAALLYVSGICGFQLYNRGRELQDAKMMIKGYKYLMGVPIAVFMTGVYVISLIPRGWPDDALLLATYSFGAAVGLALCGLGIFSFIKCLKTIRKFKAIE